MSPTSLRTIQKSLSHSIIESTQRMKNTYSATTSLHRKVTVKSLEEASEHGPRRKFCDDLTKKERPMNRTSSTLILVHTAAYPTVGLALASTEWSVGYRVHPTFGKSFHSLGRHVVSHRDQSNGLPHSGQGKPGMNSPSKNPQCGQSEVMKSSPKTMIITTRAVSSRFGYRQRLTNPVQYKA